MLARLIMVLILALTSLPLGASAATATVACHEQAMPMPHHTPAPATPVEHGCIGCIPPSDWLGTRVAAPTPVVASPPSTRVRVLAIGSGQPPALPPPRTA